MSANDDNHGAITVSNGGVARCGRLGLQRLRAAELYDAWLFAETDATLALAAWWSAPADGKGGAYARYLAALGREGDAADRLELRLSPMARAAPA